MDVPVRTVSDNACSRQQSGNPIGCGVTGLAFADLSGDVVAVERHEIVDGSAEAGRALTAEVASRGSGAVAGGGVVMRS